MTPLLTIKICGLSTAATLEAALAAGADMVGFVFFAKSPRHIELEAARELGRRVEGRALKVALSVDADDQTLAGIIAHLDPDLLQLHGSEAPERVAAVRRRFGLPVMKAIAVAEANDFAAIDLYAPVVDRLLFDAKAPREAQAPGGNGRVFDWQLLAGLDCAKPYLLSGGLSADNVAAALAITQAPGIDVSSGVESAPGIKDPAAIACFIRAARQAAAALGSTPATA